MLAKWMIPHRGSSYSACCSTTCSSSAPRCAFPLPSSSCIVIVKIHLPFTWLSPFLVVDPAVRRHVMWSRIGSSEWVPEYKCHAMYRKPYQQFAKKPEKGNLHLQRRTVFTFVIFHILPCFRIPQRLLNWASDGTFIRIACKKKKIANELMRMIFQVASQNPSKIPTPA